MESVESFDYRIKENTINEDDLKLLNQYGIVKQPNKCKDNFIYFSCYFPGISYEEKECWNINVIKDVIHFLKTVKYDNGSLDDIKQLYSIYGRTVHVEGYEYLRSNVINHSAYRRQVPYCKKIVNGIPERQLVIIHSDHIIEYYIEKGETSQYKTSYNRIYRSKHHVKQLALKDIQKEISSAVEYKNRILEEVG
jgi:hypothetical protein